MNRYFDMIVTEKGDAVAGGQFRVLDGAGAIVPLYQDSGGTPWPGNQAVADDVGMCEFYWEAADGQTLQALDRDGALLRSILDFAAASNRANHFGQIPATDIADIDTVFEADDGADKIGFIQSGAGAVGRTLQSKGRERISVLDFGAPTNGSTDAFPAFAAAYAAAPFGATIDVPHVAGGGYYLSANPDAGTRAVIWNFDVGVKLSGPGIGNPAVGGGTFGSFRTNPWLRHNGRYVWSDLTTLLSPPGGAVTGDSWEFKAMPGADNFRDIVGTITNGSSVMTGIPDTAGIYPGDAIMAVTVIAGWPAATTREDAMRVVSVDHVAKTIVFGAGTASGTATPTNWTGGTTAGATFRIRRRHWMAGWYTGLDTGTVDNVDVHYELWNPVLNLTGAAGTIGELDLNSYASPADWSRALLITGGGTVNNPRMTAIDIQRGGETEWATGVAVRHAKVGLNTAAKYPVLIDTIYRNRIAGTDETIGYGLHFSNAPAIKGALFEGRQLTNGSPAIVIWRSTDASPGGRYIQCKSADDANELFFVDALGAIHTYAPANSGGSSTNSGSIACNGITLRGGTNIQLGHTPATATLAATGKYLSMFDSAGVEHKIPTYA